MRPPASETSTIIKEPPRPHTRGTILAAVRKSDTPLIAARLIAARAGWDVRVVSAVPPIIPFIGPPDGPIMPIDLDPARIETQLSFLREHVASVGGGKAAWSLDAVVGLPPDVIAAVAEGHDTRLVVMGLGRHGALDRLLGGEAAVQTLRCARRPILAVASEWKALPRTIVIATDFSPASIWAAKQALHVAAPDATVLLVHAWVRAELSHPMLQAQDAAYERSAPKQLVAVLREIAVPPTMQVKPVIIEGDPLRSLLDFAETHAADLIVAGTHAPRFFERLFIGSVANGLLRGASCSVFVTPPPAIGEVEATERHLTGQFRSGEPAEWAVPLQKFAERNHGRRTRLEVDDVHLGAQVQESGYALVGATYDPHDKAVELMLGDSRGGPAHLTREIRGVTEVAIHVDAHGRDDALRISHGTGQTLLTFLPSRTKAPPA